VILPVEKKQPGKSAHLTGACSRGSKAACSITAHPLRDLAYGLAITRGVDRAMADPRAALASCDRWTTDQVSPTLAATK
jgi:hypothetical protein